CYNTVNPAYENPNGSNLLQQDLEKIHEDDLEAIDLKWQLSLLSMRAKRYGYSKNHKKTVKTGQTRTRERIECTRAIGEGGENASSNQKSPFGSNIGQLPGDKTFQNSQNALNVKSKVIKSP
ncbi:hypothetical protein Tco_1172602, partial [Tanacetum coccineum]